VNGFSPVLQPPYYAVIFTAQLVPDATGYDEMAAKMADLAAQQPGYLGVESARGDDGLGITVSYWVDEAALKNWKQVNAHLLAQELGKTRFYSHYTLRVAKVGRAYDGPEGR